ncbi:MAG TPA: DUF3313 domain-containing protein [Candidatus Omnitrophota bacterium]|nr:DUF3313 domain-containing protein [Candidatus Omnitrophota bacterium]
MKSDLIKTNSGILNMVCLLLAVTTVPFFAVAGEPKSSGFMDQKNMTLRGDLPFEMSWIKPGVNWKKYQKVVIAPVDTRHLMTSNFWQEFGRTGEIEKDIAKLAKYTRASFERAFFEDPQKHFRVTFSSQPDPGVLRVEMALTELTPNKVLLKAAGFVPLYGLAATALNQTNPSRVAIEIRLKDGRTGEIVAKFADKKNEPFTLVNVDQLTWYGFAEKRVDEWSGKLVETLNRRPGQVVEKSSNFDLSPV